MVHCEPKHVGIFGVILLYKYLLLQLVGYLCYWQMGFNSVFKGLNLSLPTYHQRF